MFPGERQIKTGEPCTRTPVPKYAVSMSRGSLVDSAVTFMVKTDGTILPPLVVNYKDTLGWKRGDPRIAAFNLIAKLTSTPELVARTTVVAAERIDEAEAQKLSVSDIFQKVLTADSYDNLRDVLDTNFFVARFMRHLGLATNLLDVFSNIAGTEQDALAATRVEALLAVEGLIRLRGPILKVGLDAFREGVSFSSANVDKYKSDDSVSLGLRAEVDDLHHDAIRRFRDA